MFFVVKILLYFIMMSCKQFFMIIKDACAYCISTTLFLLVFRLNKNTIYPYICKKYSLSPKTSVFRTAKFQSLTCLTTSNFLSIGCMNFYESLLVSSKNKFTVYCLVRTREDFIWLLRETSF